MINIYDLYMAFSRTNKEDYYIDKKDNNVIEEFYYSKLSPEIRNRCTILPKDPFYKNVEYALIFQKKDEYKDLFKYFRNHSSKFLRSEEIDLLSYFHFFHGCCEAVDLWGEYDDFRTQEYQKLVKKWCNDNKIEFYSKNPYPDISDPKESCEYITKLVIEERNAPDYQEKKLFYKNKEYRDDPYLIVHNPNMEKIKDVDDLLKYFESLPDFLEG